jgi:squalene synthase HpnC
MKSRKRAPDHDNRESATSSNRPLSSDSAPIGPVSNGSPAAVVKKPSRAPVGSSGESVGGGQPWAGGTDAAAPRARDPRAVLRARRDCRRLVRSHYENFVVASVLLPRRMRQPFYNVYAFCRTADDLADCSSSPEHALTRLDEFQRSLDATFAGNPPAGPFLALRETIEAFGLPKRPFDELLEAFRQDQRRRRYPDWPSLLDYCRRSANPVGHLVLHLGGCFDEANASLSDRICTGLQLANFWQDVRRDFEIGRVYLPGDAMERHGVTEETLRAPSAPDGFKRLLGELCERTERLFREGLPLADQVPPWLAGDIRLFAHGGLATLQAISAIDFDVLARRPRVSPWRQLKLVGNAWLGRL